MVIFGFHQRFKHSVMWKFLFAIATVLVGFYAYDKVYGIFASDKPVEHGKVIPISDLEADTRKYEGIKVTVEGEVGVSANVGLKAYKLSDGTGEIWVRTRRSVPNKGERLKVTGDVSQLLKIGDMDALTITEE
jgi:hypothetical protein